MSAESDAPTGPTTSSLVLAVAEGSANDGTSKGFRREARSVKIPTHRFPPLKRIWMEIYTPVVEQCKLEIRMNLKSRSVELRTCEATTDRALLQKAEDFVKAVVAGFEVKDAMALLRMDDIYIEGFEVKDVRANLAGDNLSRCIGRMSGSHGKTRYTIENVTRTRLVIADTHIHIMGTTQNIRAARDAICDLIRGSPAAKVYNRIRAVMNRVSDSF
jgi:RNA-binding protein PNO1